MKFFGQNSQNFQVILSIVISSIYHEDIKFEFNFPFHDNYFDQVEKFVSSFQNEKDNQLSQTNNIISNTIKKKENESKSIKINNLNIDKGTNLINEEYKSSTHEDIKETNVEGENNNNESINNAELNTNNQKKNKKRKIRNKTKNLRL